MRPIHGRKQAYDWLLAQRLEDGAWLTGIASGDYGYVAGYHRLAHSRWGYRSNTSALNCLVHHPERRSDPEDRRALDLLLGRETWEKHTLGFEVARLIGVEPAWFFSPTMPVSTWHSSSTCAGEWVLVGAMSGLLNWTILILNHNVLLVDTLL